MTAISNNKQTLNKEGYKLTSFNKHNNNNIHLISLSLPLSVCAGYVFMVPFAETVITYWWLFYLKCSITAVGDTNTVINMHTETHKYTLHALHISRVWLKEKATTTFSVLLALPFSLIVAFAFRLKDQTQTIKKKGEWKIFYFDIWCLQNNCTKLHVSKNTYIITNKLAAYYIFESKLKGDLQNTSKVSHI